jgi:hypothetical protein
MIHHAEIAAQHGWASTAAFSSKKWPLQTFIACSSLTGGYPFEETPAGAFLSEYR